MSSSYEDEDSQAENDEDVSEVGGRLSNDMMMRNAFEGIDEITEGR